MKKRLIAKITALLLAAVTVFSLWPSTTNAAAATALTSGGKYITAAKGKYYRISAEKEGYVTLTITAKGEASLEILTSSTLARSKCRYTVNDRGNDVQKILAENETRTVKIPVSPGDLYVYCSNPGQGTQIKMTFTGWTHNLCCCVAKAKPLAQNTTATVIQSPNYHFDRWREIELESSQKVTITHKGADVGYFVLYDASQHEIDMTRSETDPNTWTTDTLVAAGTYYIKICAPYPDGSASYETIKWK